MDDGIGELSAAEIIRIGGWNPRYARVLLIEHDHDFAVVLVDGNGDGAELELEYWQRDADGLWHGGSSSGHGPLDRLRPRRAGTQALSSPRSAGSGRQLRSASSTRAASTGGKGMSSAPGASSTRPIPLGEASCQQ